MWLVAAATAAQEQTPTQQGAQLTILQQIEASTAAWAAERRIHEKAIAKEIAERRKLLNLVFRGADNALSRKRDEDLIARAHEAALELQRRWSGPK